MAEFYKSHFSKVSYRTLWNFSPHLGRFLCYASAKVMGDKSAYLFQPVGGIDESSAIARDEASPYLQARVDEVIHDHPEFRFQLIQFFLIPTLYPTLERSAAALLSGDGEIGLLIIHDRANSQSFYSHSCTSIVEDGAYAVTHGNPDGGKGRHPHWIVAVARDPSVSATLERHQKLLTDHVSSPIRAGNVKSIVLELARRQRDYDLENRNMVVMTPAEVQEFRSRCKPK